MRNVKLAYILSYLSMSSFWGGIWVLYYLLFTNYAGIGIIEFVMIITSTVTEIPTGAIADLIGRKKTLMLSSILLGIGSLIMGIATSFLNLLFSVVLMSTGRSLYSGTMESLVYDSLKEKKKEHSYDRIIANITAIQLVAFALSTAIGGFMYSIKPGLPFIAVGVAHGLGFIAAFLLVEPKIDTVKFSLDNYLKQTKKGFSELFKNENIKKQTIFLVSIGIFTVIVYEVLNDILAIEFGFNEKQLGVLVSVAYLISAGVSIISSRIIRIHGEIVPMLFLSMLFGLSLILSPVFGFILGGLFIIFRAGAMSIFSNVSSYMINRNTESKYRATTLSTFSMITKLPYMVSAFFIGILMDLWTAKIFASILGLILVASIAIQIKNFSFQKKQ